MKVSTMIATIALMTPAIQAQFCNRNSPLVCCLSVKSQGCVSQTRIVCFIYSANRICRSAQIHLKTYVLQSVEALDISLTYWIVL